MELNEILVQTISKGASDLHLKHGLRPIIRRNGELEVLSKDLDKLTGEKIKEMAYGIMTQEQRTDFDSKHELDMGYGVSGLGRFRVNIFKQRGTLRMVVRSIPMDVPSFNQLKLPEKLADIANYERGLILVTGVTGSGKSTTMASIVDYINQTKRKHIITIEDPIEYIIADRKSIISQRELHQDTHGWEIALRSALREDPDVVLVGEMRDYETIAAAITVAETGHLVFATLHTNNAAQTVDRIIDVFPEHQQAQVRQQLASSLQAVVSQRLVPMNGGGRVAACEVIERYEAIQAKEALRK